MNEDIVAETIMLNPRSIMATDAVETTNETLQASDTFDPSEILVQVLQRPTDPLNERLQEALYSWVSVGMAYQPVRDMFGGWIDVARNWQTSLFRKATNHKWLLMVDADVGPPLETPLMLRRHGLPLVSAVVCGFNGSRGGLFVCVAKEGRDGEPRFITHKNHKTLPAKGLMEVTRAGAGCLMIRRDVIETLWTKYEKELKDQDVATSAIARLLKAEMSGCSLKLSQEQRDATESLLRRFSIKTDLYGAPFNIPQSVRDKAAEIGAMPLGEDIMFTNRVRAAGFKMYVDLECRCRHDKMMTLVWPEESIDEHLSVDDFQVSIYDTPVEITGKS